MIRRYLLMWPHPSSFSSFLFFIYIFIYMIDEICSKEFYILYSTDGHLNFFFSNSWIKIPKWFFGI